MKINKLSIISLLAVVISVLSVRTSQAQVTVSLNMLPPYSPFYRDYAGFNHDYLSTNNTIVTLISSSNAQVYLTSSIKKDDNSISITVKDAYRSSMPINLTANIPVVQTGIQLKNIYGSGSTNDLMLTGITSNEIIYNQALPEGNYTVCIQARDFTTGAVLGEDCRNIYIAYYEPPQITSPQNMTSVYSKYPQFVLTSWACSTPFRAGIKYRLRIVKLVPGVSATDALKNSTQVVLDKSNIFTSTYMLDLTSGVILDTGAAYAMQVTASSSLAYFKNNGESEPVVFYYKGTNFKIPGIDGVTLNFIKPNAKQNYIETNNETPLLINWNWFDAGNGGHQGKIINNDTIFLNDQAYKTYGITKYKVKIENSGKNLPSDHKVQPHFSYRKTINRVHDSLVSYLMLPQKVCDSLGFADSYWYKASVEAYDVESNLVTTAESVDFQYRKIKDEEPTLKIPVNAVLKYMFKDNLSATFNATNTPVEVDVLKKRSVVHVVAPPITINNISYIKIAQTTGTTDNIGGFHDAVLVPVKFLTGDSLYLRIKMGDQYYIDKDFPLRAIHAVDRDTSVNFGPLVAQTYAYSLKIDVKKEYTSYSLSEKDGAMNANMADSIFSPGTFPYQYTSAGGKGTMTYAVESKTLADSVTIVLFRKNKQSHVPPVEGDIKDYDHTSGYVEVARSMTHREKKDTSNVTVVNFEHLLASVFDGDEYYILALNGKNYPDVPKQKHVSMQNDPNQIIEHANDLPNNSSSNGLSLENNSNEVVHDPWNNSFNPYTNLVFTDDGFIAEKKLFQVAVPKGMHSRDSLYRHITTDYNIVSTRPPTSLVKGRLLYHWKSDNGDQMRPLANSGFKIVVDYLVDNKPIGYVNMFTANGSGFTYSSKFFVPDGKTSSEEGIELLDFDKTMAVGTTDDQGNFEVEVINFNKKGDLGQGHIENAGWSYHNPNNEETEKPGQFDPGDYFHMEDPGWGGDDNWGYVGDVGLIISGQQNTGTQYLMNHDNHLSFNTGGGYFVVGTGGGINTHSGEFTPGSNTPGPRNNYVMLADSKISNDNPTVNFQRVYRVIPDNQYIYPSKESFIVDAFAAKNLTEAQTCYVKEVKVRVHSEDINTHNKLDQMKVTVFRNIMDKTTDLPLGEGDGEYKYTQLISPQYKTQGEIIDKQDADKLNPGNNIFDQKFELLGPPVANSSDGWASFSTLLAGFDNYYVEVCSDPDGNRSYEATFSSVNTDIKTDNPDLWMGTASPPDDTIKLKLSPLHSRALVRLLDNSSGNSISPSKCGKVTLNYLYPTPVDSYGYVEFLANATPLSHFTGSVVFRPIAKGYKPSPGNEYSTYSCGAFGCQKTIKFSLDPAMVMKGRIVNMDTFPHSGVPSYVKVDSGQVVQTDNLGNFKNLGVPGIENTKIFIIPKNIAFFDSTYLLTKAQSLQSNVDLGDFGVYRRRHRIKFIVNTVGNYYLNDATVQLGDSIKKTKSQGTVTYNFENVSVNNFSFIIRGPDGQNYIPKTLNLDNTESKTYVTKIVTLEMGSEVDGIVKLNGTAVQHAKVYIDVQQQANLYPPFNNSSLPDDANLVVAYTNAAGKYYLKGVPNNSSVFLHAILDTSFTVSGDIQKAVFSNHFATTNLNLNSFKSMLVNNIYGFPLSVEKITPMNADSSQVKVTGVVHWSKAISNFALDETNQVLRIENVIYKSATVNGKKVGVPQDASVAIEGITNLKFKYLNKYNVKLTTIPTNGIYNIYNPPPLYITKENDLGVIRGRISIVDNSFNYPSTYLNFSDAVHNFYLADKINENLVTTNIGAVTSALTETQTNNNYYQNYSLYMGAIETVIGIYQNQPKPLYYLSDANGDSIKFKLIEFDAKANPTKSFIDVDGKIHLNVNLKCHINNAQPPDFKLNIADMVLDNDKVYPAVGALPMALTFEKWVVNIKDWSFSTQEGGIVSHNNSIHTAALDIPFTTFVLRNDLFLMDNYQMTDLKMAGGTIALKNIKSDNAHVVYDNKTGSDLNPHWRFSLTGDPAANLETLTDLNGPIILNYIQILSNNEMVFQLQEQTTPFTIRNNTLAKYTPESIYNGPDFISIAGLLHIDAPRMSPIHLNLKYTNPTTQTLESVETEFEGQGFVHFTSINPGYDVPNITINSSQITIMGNVCEKPVKTFNPMDATFYAINGSPPVFKVDIKPGFVLQLDKNDNIAGGQKGHKLVVDKGGMTVNGNDWSILTYEGKMSSNTPDTNTKPLNVKYTVMGDISANANGLEVSQIKTPFGQMKMVIDFVNKCTIGSITMNNIPLGTTMLTGTVETLFGEKGFYIAGGCNADVKIPSIVDGTYNMGFMIGAYHITDELWSVVNSYKNPAVQNNCYRAKYPDLSGIYFTLDRVIIDKSIDFDFVLASGYVQANALIGADVWTNFKPFGFGMQAHVFAHAAAGLSAITGTSINGDLSALAVLEFAESEGKLSANGTINLGFMASISQSLVFTTISKDIKINCHAAAGTSGFSFSLGDGDAVVKCP